MRPCCSHLGSGCTSDPCLPRPPIALGVQQCLTVHKPPKASRFSQLFSPASQARNRHAALTSFSVPRKGLPHTPGNRGHGKFHGSSRPASHTKWVALQFLSGTKSGLQLEGNRTCRQCKGKRSLGVAFSLPVTVSPNLRAPLHGSRHTSRAHTHSELQS